MKLGIPQIIYLVLWGIILLGTAVLNGRVRSRTTYNFYESAFFGALQFGLMWWGGFF